MTDTSAFVRAQERGVNRTPPGQAPGFRFEPGSDVGEATLRLDGDESHEAALDRWAADLLGVDPGVMTLLEVTDVRAWAHNPETGQPYRYVRCLVRRQSTELVAVKAALDKWLGRHPKRQRKGSKPSVGTPADVYLPLQDTQIGRRRDRLGGLEETVARCEWVTGDGFGAYLDTIKSSGIAPDRIVIPLGGDLTEGCDSRVDDQRATNVLNLADQFEVALSIVDRAVEHAIDRAPEVVVTACASNHDQQARRGGRGNITDPADDRSLMMLRVLARMYAGTRPSVRVEMPQDPNVWIIAGPLTVAGIHGHVPRFRQNATVTGWLWWQSAIANRRQAAAAQVLCMAHFHHFHRLSQSGRVLIGLSSLDGGSDWFEAQGGDWSLPGTTCFSATADGVRHAEDLVWPQDRDRAREQTGLQIA